MWMDAVANNFIERLQICSVLEQKRSSILGGKIFILHECLLQEEIVGWWKGWQWKDYLGKGEEKVNNLHSVVE